MQKVIRVNEVFTIVAGQSVVYVSANDPVEFELSDGDYHRLLSWADIEADDGVVIGPGPKKCTCPIETLMTCGCRCGGV